MDIIWYNIHDKYKWYNLYNLFVMSEDRGRITELICILVPADKMKQKCFQSSI